MIWVVSRIGKFGVNVLMIVLVVKMFIVVMSSVLFVNFLIKNVVIGIKILLVNINEVVSYCVWLVFILKFFIIWGSVVINSV